MSVAPDQNKVKAGFARDDLFVCVHEQFMTETAQVADVVLPATTFLEHDDIYRGGGHQYIILGPKLVEPPGECRNNHEVICALAKRLGAEHKGFTMSPRELIDDLLRRSNRGTLAELEANRWLDCQPPFRQSHYLDGFPWPDGKFRFKPDWENVPFRSPYKNGPIADMPALPDHWTSIEQQDDAHPFRLATSPARGFLNSTFTETPTSLANEKRPTVMIHPDDAAALRHRRRRSMSCSATSAARCACTPKLFDGVRRGVLIAESIWPNSAYADGCGINTLTGADPIAPYGGAAFHDNKVWVRRLGSLSRRAVRSELLADRAVDRVGPAAADRDGEQHDADQQHVFVAAFAGAEAVRPMHRQMAISISMASAAAKKRVNRPKMMQSAPIVSRKMAA